VNFILRRDETGAINSSVLARLIHMIEVATENGPQLVTLRAYEAKRKVEQNSYYWAMLSQVAAWNHEHGIEPSTTLVIHEQMKMSFQPTIGSYPFEMMVDSSCGGVVGRTVDVPIPKSTTDNTVKEMADLLEKKGTKVTYAIHPVAGRMPGHMNVLLAEADVPYEQLIEMDAINPEFKQTDAVLIVGANDVVNPAAEKDPTSPIAGMPVLEVWNAQSVMMIKRSLSPGFAGIKNELFEYPNNMMVFGDAKKVLQEIVGELKDLIKAA